MCCTSVTCVADLLASLEQLSRGVGMDEASSAVVLHKYKEKKEGKCTMCILNIYPGLHRLEKYLNLESFPEKSLKIKSALKSTGKITQKH